MDVRHTIEMSVSREEFFRLLPAAVGEFALEGQVVRWSDRGCRGTIRLIPLPAHRLGSVIVPRHRVEIVLEGCTEADSSTFMDRWHRAFLRGGG
jgi:hypothetical protein